MIAGTSASSDLSVLDAKASFSLTASDTWAFLGLSVQDAATLLRCTSEYPLARWHSLPASTLTRCSIASGPGTCVRVPSAVKFRSASSQIREMPVHVYFGVFAACRAGVVMVELEWMVCAGVVVVVLCVVFVGVIVLESV